VFYGWWVVATAALALCLGAGPIVVFSFGVFFKPLSQDFHAGGYAFGAFALAGALGTLLMGAGFDFPKAYTAPLAGFFVAMLVAVWLMTRLGPYRYAAEKPHKTHGVTPVQAESLG
jgi:hypothetical protein